MVIFFTRTDGDLKLSIEIDKSQVAYAAEGDDRYLLLTAERFRLKRCSLALNNKSRLKSKSKPSKETPFEFVGFDYEVYESQRSVYRAADRTELLEE